MTYNDDGNPHNYIFVVDDSEDLTEGLIVCVAPTDYFNIEVQYTFEAATPEEASFIRDLREYGTAYNPIGSSTSCPKCETFFVFEKSSSCCPLCGKVEN